MSPKNVKAGIFSRRFATPRQRRILFSIHNGLCAVCHVQLRKGWHAHHIRHHAQGGYTSLDNLMPVCRECHKVMHGSRLMPSPRRWQQDCLERTSRESHVLVQAGVGSGKGYYTPAHFYERLVRGLTDFGVFLAPSQTILEGITDWGRQLGLTIERCENPSKDISTDYVPSACNGVALTYAGMSEEVTGSLIEWARRCKMFVSLDEAHHITGPNGGGRVGVQSLRINRLLEHAKQLLLTTATPFRSDMLELLGVKYENGIAIPTYEYTYMQSVIDGYCRRLYAEGQDGIARVVIDGVEVSKRVSEIERDDVEKIGVGLGTELVDRIIDRTYEQHLLARQKYPDAATLFVAPPTKPPARSDDNERDQRENDEKNAETLRRIVKQRTGIDPVVLTSDDRDSRTKISRFRKGTEPLVVAIRMISEGVDIPRIRNIGLCAHIMSEALLIQIVGRELRAQEKDKGAGVAHMFFPDYSWMRDTLQKMTAEARAAEDFISKKPPTGGDPPAKRMVFGIGATFDSREAVAPVAITGQELYHNDMIDYVDRMIEDNPFLDRGTASTVINSVWSQLKQEVPVHNNNGEPHKKGFDEAWKEFSKAVTRYGKQLEVSGYPDQYRKIYAEAYAEVGRRLGMPIKSDKNGNFRAWIRMNAPDVVPHLSAYIYEAMSKDKRIQGD